MKFSSNVMKLNNVNSVPYLTYNSLSEIDFINHAFSTRLGGVSTDEFTSMNLAFNRGDSPENVTENYKRFCKSAGFDYESLTASSQDHHTFVRAVTKENVGVGIYKPKDIESVDALITNEPGVTLVTYYADCTPLFFVDTKQKAIGLAHAGWRGTVGRIGDNVVKKMQSLYGTDPSDIKAAIGPAISVCCYEVDKPCADNFLALDELDSTKFVFPKGNGKFMIDLLETNRQILVHAGVKNENITVSDVCTNCNSELLWSHRATKGHRGTMSAFMCIK
ncbi:MAG: peptidoglycan editing factor PgeF [Ruminococcus bromii]|nr:peptidoglycan editing factor PgeF [Ruminococcus bromii]MDY4085547.1 peptidoglycan editing factor PgeF [Ruminococcus bromii]MDY4710648.1 peptidoglycan editing factor PgeF [Ruminococcus bromii]